MMIFIEKMHHFFRDGIRGKKDDLKPEFQFINFQHTISFKENLCPGSMYIYSLTASISWCYS